MKAHVQSMTQTTTFQIKLILLMMATSFFSNLQLHSSHFLYMNPAFSCQGIQGKQNEEYACRNLDICKIIQATSVTAAMHLYCDQRTNDRILIQSSVGIGDWVGTIFVALVSDRFGRSFCFTFALIFQTIFCIVQYIGVNNNMTSLLFISEIAFGSAAKGMYVNFLILSTRFLKKSVYQIITICWLMSSSCSVILISIIIPFISTWKGLFFIYSIAFVLITGSSFFVLYEDPMFYFELRQFENCKYVLRNIGMENGDNQQEIYRKIIQVDDCIEYIEDKPQNNYSFRQLLRCDILMAIISIGLVGCCMSIANVGLDYSIQGLQLSYHQNLFLTGFASFVGQLTASAYILTVVYVIQAEQKKKRGFLITSIISGIAGCFFAFQFCLQNAVIESVLIIILWITLAWINNFYIRLKVDVFPEKYQGLLISVVEFVTNLGRVITPQIVHISTAHNVSPIFVTDLIRVVGTLSILMISEERIDLDQKKQ